MSQSLAIGVSTKMSPNKGSSFYAKFSPSIMQKLYGGNYEVY